MKKIYIVASLLVSFHSQAMNFVMHTSENSIRRSVAHDCMCCPNTDAYSVYRRYGKVSYSMYRGDLYFVTDKEIGTSDMEDLLCEWIYSGKCKRTCFKVESLPAIEIENTKKKCVRKKGAKDQEQRKNIPPIFRYKFSYAKRKKVSLERNTEEKLRDSIKLLLNEHGIVALEELEAM